MVMVIVVELFFVGMVGNVLGNDFGLGSVELVAGRDWLARPDVGNLPEHTHGPQ